MKTYTAEEEYRRSLDSREYLLDVYELSEEQISQGKTKNAKESLASVREKYGL